MLPQRASSEQPPNCKNQTSALFFCSMNRLNLRVQKSLYSNPIRLAAILTSDGIRKVSIASTTTPTYRNYPYEY